MVPNETTNGGLIMNNAYDFFTSGQKLKAASEYLGLSKDFNDIKKDKRLL